MVVVSVCCVWYICLSGSTLDKILRLCLAPVFFFRGLTHQRFEIFDRLIFGFRSFMAISRQKDALETKILDCTVIQIIDGLPYACPVFLGSIVPLVSIMVKPIFLRGQENIYLNFKFQDFCQLSVLICAITRHQKHFHFFTSLLSLSMTNIDR